MGSVYLQHVLDALFVRYVVPLYLQSVLCAQCVHHIRYVQFIQYAQYNGYCSVLRSAALWEIRKMSECGVWGGGHVYLDF